MGKIGGFKSTEAEDAFLDAYDALEGLWPLPARVDDVPTAFGTTRVRRTGDGPGTPIVLLHGYPGSGLSWHGAVSSLTENREVIAPDTIGTAGRSVQTAPIDSDEDFAEWFVGLLDGLGLERVHVVGESQGAWHAALVAIHAPQRVASVTLIEPNGVFTRTPLKALVKMLKVGARPSEAAMTEVQDWMTPGITLTDEELRCIRAAIGFKGGLGWARRLRDREVASIEPPLLAIFGADSVLSRPAESVARLTQHVAHATVEVYPGAGHGVKGQMPDTVYARILSFVRMHDGT